MNKEKSDEFQKLATPLIEWLKKNFHPHVVVLVDNQSAQLMEGVASVVVPYETPNT